MTTERVFIGIDAGGTKSELVAECTDGKTIALIGESANIQRVGAEESARRLATLIEGVRKDLGEYRIAGICAGIAGAGRPSDRKAVLGSLVPLLSQTIARSASSPIPVRVVHDGVIALETGFPGGSGIIVITGTGSISYGRSKDGTVERGGGWGYLLGDEGSGYVIGLHGVRAVLGELEGGPPTKLKNLVRDKFDLRNSSDIIRKVYAGEWALQKVAPLVLQAAREQDEQALQILVNQADLLAEQVSWLAKRLQPEIENRIGLLGGLAKSALYRNVLGDAFALALPGWELFAVASRPVIGAVALAQNIPDDDPDVMVVEPA